MSIDNHPIKPRATLRVAIAGNRVWPANLSIDDLTQKVDQTFDALADGMNSLAIQREHAIYRYWSREPALLRGLSGLADGADQLMVARLLSLKNQDVTTEHVAILPFKTDVYRDKSSVSDATNYDTLLGCADATIELDGIYRPNPKNAGNPTEAQLAKRSRGRAYRSQSLAMLSQSDLLIAVLDFSAAAKPGGTRETIHAALERGIPIIVLALETQFNGEVTTCEVRRYCVDNSAQFAELELARDSTCEAKTADIANLVTQLIGIAGQTEQVHMAASNDSLADYFPEVTTEIEPTQRAQKKLAIRWGNFVKPFIAQSAASTADPESHFLPLRNRAKNINYRYMERYRGGFLSNFQDAAMAGTIAVIALLCIAIAYALLQHPIHCPPTWNCPAPLTELPWWFKAPLLALAVWKLLLVIGISRRTHAARHKGWNDRAIQARYLSETLRVMLWLPRLGLVRAPKRVGAHLAETTLRRSAVDWLLNAIVRSAPTTLTAQQITRNSLLTELSKLRTGWIQGQIDYHKANAQTMLHMDTGLDERATILANIVIAVVLFDIVLLVLGLAFSLPTLVDLCKFTLIATAAVLPAWLAATNGIHEQSECHRLAERSKQMQTQLETLRAEVEALILQINNTPAESDPGSWSLVALALAEQCSDLVAEDVAEWSVLYSKQILEG